MRDLGRYVGCEHETRFRAIVALRDLLLDQGDYERAQAIQMELLEGQRRQLGPDHPETLAARDDLATILLATLEQEPSR